MAPWMLEPLRARRQRQVRGSLTAVHQRQHADAQDVQRRIDVAIPQACTVVAARQAPALDIRHLSACARLGVLHLRHQQ